MSGRVSLLLLTLGGALLVATGVTRTAGSAEAPKGGTLRLGLGKDLDFVDPALAYSTLSSPLGFATCAKLFNHPDKPGAAGTRLVPEVVHAWTVSRDGRTYDFELKRTFRFHRGATVTASSFVDAFNRVANPRLKSPATAFMREIVGAVAVMEGKAKAISGVRVLGRYRLQIRLTRAVGDFTARLTLPFFCPVLPGSPVDPAGMNDPPGSGPYYVAERIVNRQIVLKRNPYYRGRRPAHVDQVVLTIGQSPEACLLATKQDRIDHCDLLILLPPATIRRLAQTYGINRPAGRFFVSPSLFTVYLALNHDRPAFKGPGQIALKKAINYAINRTELARVFGYRAGKPTDQILPTAVGRDERIYPLQGNVAMARKWLARATLKPSTLIFYTRNHRNGVGVARVLGANLKQIGIDLDVKYYDDATMFEKAGTRGEPFDIALGGSGSTMPTPPTPSRGFSIRTSVRRATGTTPTSRTRASARGSPRRVG